MPRYKLTIAYDGTDFVGWQKQEPPERGPESKLPVPDASKVLEGYDSVRPGRMVLRSVQAVLERAVREAVREPVLVKGASRTDSGVHAGGFFPDGRRGGQVAAFTCSDGDGAGIGWPVERGAWRLAQTLNSKLPPDLLVLDAEVVEDGFDPISDCTAKGYSYTIFCGKTRPLWRRREAYFYRGSLDVEAMREAAEAVVGEHDFASFAAAGHGRRTTVRTVYGCEVSEEPCARDDGTIVRMKIWGNGFLYNMVRILGGTLVAAGAGKIAPADVAGIIEAKDRTKAGATLPPEGLCLEWVEYGGAQGAGSGAQGSTGGVGLEG